MRGPHRRNGATRFGIFRAIPKNLFSRRGRGVIPSSVHSGFSVVNTVEAERREGLRPCYIGPTEKPPAQRREHTDTPTLVASCYRRFRPPPPAPYRMSAPISMTPLTTSSLSTSPSDTSEASPGPGPSTSRHRYKTVAVLGASYGGARGAKLLSQGLPVGWRLVVIDRNSHMNRESIIPVSALQLCGADFW